MLAKFRPRSVYDVMAALSLFLVIAGGSAYAANTVFSTDIVDGQVKSPDLAGAAVTNSKLGSNSVGTGKVLDNSLAAVDLAPGSVGASEVADNSLTGTDVLDNALKGADIAESSLGQVPVATLGGLGRSAAAAPASTPCDPEPSSTYIRCVQVQLNLSSPARVLLNGRITAMHQGSDHANAEASCRWGGVQESGPLEMAVPQYGQEDMSLVGVTGVLPAGQGYTFAIECREELFHVSGVSYRDAWITAVAISPN